MCNEKKCSLTLDVQYHGVNFKTFSTQKMTLKATMYVLIQEQVNTLSKTQMGKKNEKDISFYVFKPPQTLLNAFTVFFLPLI